MTIKLEDLKPGVKSKSKRVGRGRASGHGKTSCRGHNGEGQRSGASSKRGFEGGQMPSYRRLPKLRGFKLINKTIYAQLNIRDIEHLPIDEISLEALKSIKKAHSSCEGLRVIGNGDISKKVSIKANYVTPAAKEKIEKAGGKVELI